MPGPRDRTLSAYFEFRFSDFCFNQQRKCWTDIAAYIDAERQRRLDWARTYAKRKTTFQSENTIELSLNLRVANLPKFKKVGAINRREKPGSKLVPDKETR